VILVAKDKMKWKNGRHLLEDCSRWIKREKMSDKKKEEKRKEKQIVGNERIKVHWISHRELDFILRGINVARTDKAKQGIK
jgi:hypothetical protein